MERIAGIRYSLSAKTPQLVLGNFGGSELLTSRGA
jgi:hypothetical protein